MELLLMVGGSTAIYGTFKFIDFVCSNLGML